jgi:hypothetical protein
MGIFTVECEVINAARHGKSVAVEKMMVESGAEFAWIPQALLKQAGVDVQKQAVPFLMTNGRTITRPMGYAIIRCGEFETVDEVVFGRRGDLCLMGARTLEGFGALVDPAKKRLVAGGPHPAAGGVVQEKE